MKKPIDRTKIYTVGAVALLAGTIGFLNRSHTITPKAMADVTWDGVPDALVFSRAPMTSREGVGYFNGKNIWQDENGQYFSRGGAIPLAGIVLPESHNYRENGSIVAGNFDDDPRTDIIVSVPTEDFPVTIDQVFNNVLAAPTQVR